MEVLDWFGRVLASPALAYRSRRPARWLTVLAYHRVLPTPGADYEYDRAVIDCDPGAFRLQMETVARDCSPITLDELLRFLRGEQQLPPSPVLVTFDDGYLDNRVHALPVLEQLGIPAVFFVSTTFVTERRVFWWDRVAYLFGRSRVSVAQLRYPTQLMLRPIAERDAGQRAILRIIKTCRGLDVDRLLVELGRALRVEWNEEIERAIARDLVMTWDDVRDLRRAGMEIGSHTATHRVLQTLEPAALTGELVQSRDAIAAELGAAPRAISYPVGRSLRRTPALARAVQDAGYQVGFSAEQRAIPVRGGAIDAFDLARVPVDVGITPHHLRTLLAVPELCRSW